MYLQGSAIAYSASNRVDDFALGIDRDFFRSLSRMAARKMAFAIRGLVEHRMLTHGGSEYGICDPRLVEHRMLTRGGSENGICVPRASGAPAGKLTLAGDIYATSICKG